MDAGVYPQQADFECFPGLGQLLNAWKESAGKIPYS